MEGAEGAGGMSSGISIRGSSSDGGARFWSATSAEENLPALRVLTIGPPAVVDGRNTGAAGAAAGAGAWWVAAVLAVVALSIASRADTERCSDAV